MGSKPTQKWRWTAVVFGMTALLAVLVAEKKSAARDDALIMPTENAAFDGVYEEVKADWFTVEQPAMYEFEVSEATRLQADSHITFDGAWPRRWYSYTPKVKDKIPLVILLHGAGRDGLSLIEMWKDVAQQNGVALVAPNSIGPTWSLDNPDPHFIEDIVAEMSLKYQIDPDQIFLFGHSDGASYAQILLNRTQGPWRAAALHAGYAPKSRLRPARYPKPIRMYFGENEQVFDLDQARDIGRWFARQGSHSDLIIIPQHNHWFYKMGPQIAEDSWKWFASTTN